MHHMSRFGSDHGDSGGSNGGAKRSFEKIQEDDFQGTLLGDKRQKLPALASVVIKAVQMDKLQKLCSSLEPILRKVVGEEVERILARHIPNRLGARTSPPSQLQESPVSDLRLDFRTKLSLPLFTGGKVEGEGGLPILIVLKDGSTGQVLTTGAVSTAKLEVVVLDGDFINEEEEWTAEDFDNHVVKEREGKRPLLTGDLSVTLKEGVGTLGELSFTDNSSWIRSRKFKLGVRVAPGSCNDIRIQECMTDAFIVKDHRGELYKKHYPPSLHDEVWRLDKIGKDGAFHKKLQQNNINTVEDFLRCYIRDQKKLRNVLGTVMSNKMWDVTVEHAKTCVLSGKLYVFYADRSRSVGVIFNHIYELLGVTSYNTYKSADSLTDDEKVYVDKLVKAAYDNWSLVTEYENGDLSAETSHRHTVMQNENEELGVAQEQASVYSQPMGLLPQPGTFQSMPRSTSLAEANMSGSQLHGYGAEPSSGYTGPDSQVMVSSQFLRPGSHASSTISLQYGFPTANENISTGLAHGPSQGVSRPYGVYSNPPLQAAFQGNSAEWMTPNPMTPSVDIFVNEEILREKTVEMLGHEDIQQLLRSQYLPHSESTQLQGGDAWFNPSPAVPFNEGVRSPGKQNVGWLKLKAALRWGIFIRNIAAKKAVLRAQVEEIED